jgi:nicotinic acid mononucleotide adenylyltransferase
MEEEIIPERTIIFTIARMNPPTPGHLQLIENLINEAIIRNVNEVFIILSRTIDNDENPIQCPEKINILGNDQNNNSAMIHLLKISMITKRPDLEDKINNIIVHFICVPEPTIEEETQPAESMIETLPSKKGKVATSSKKATLVKNIISKPKVKKYTPFSVLGNIIGRDEDTPNTNLLFIVGEDRADLLDNIKRFYSKMKKMKSIQGIILKRENMEQYKQMSKNCETLGSLNMIDVPRNAMSASFVRNIVKCKNFDKFRELYGPYIANEEKIRNLYDNIEQGFAMSEVASGGRRTKRGFTSKKNSKKINKSKKSKKIRRK